MIGKKKSQNLSFSRQTGRPDRERSEGQVPDVQPAQGLAPVHGEEADGVAVDTQPRRPGAPGAFRPQLRVLDDVGGGGAARAAQRLARKVRDAHREGRAKVRNTERNHEW